MATYDDDHGNFINATPAAMSSTNDMLRFVSLMSTLGLDETSTDTRITSLVEAISTSDPSALSAPPTSKKVIDNLPTVSRVPVDRPCPVCTEDFDEEPAKRLPCHHYFHGDCVRPWLEKHNTCPMCRAELPTDDPKYEQAKRDKAREEAAKMMYNHMVN